MEVTSRKLHHGGYQLELTPWNVPHGTYTMLVSSSNVHHGGYLMEPSPWKLLHGTNTMEVT